MFIRYVSSVFGLQTKPLRSPLEASLVVQWLRLLTSNAGGVASIPGWRTKIPYAMLHSQKKGKTDSLGPQPQQSSNIHTLSSTHSPTQAVYPHVLKSSHELLKECKKEHEHSKCLRLHIPNIHINR